MPRRHPDADRVGGAVGVQDRTESDEPSVAAARDSPDPRVRTLADRVAQLEAELERAERRHRDVVQRYERLLADARSGDCAEESAGRDDRGRRRDRGRGRGRGRERDRGPLAWLRSLLRR
ncbi:MAG: hypothetical protein ABEI11_01680 [Haloarculaceae archaeon]